MTLSDPAGVTQPLCPSAARCAPPALPTDCRFAGSGPTSASGELAYLSYTFHSRHFSMRKTFTVFPEVCVANVFSGYLPLCFVENIFLKIDFRTILDLQKNLNDSIEISHPPQTQLPLLLTPVSVVHWLQLINQEMLSLTIVRTAFRFPVFT